MGIAALVLGILSIICGLIISTLLGIIMAVVGIYLGYQGRKENAKCAQAGFIVSIVCLVIIVILFIITMM